MTLLHLGTSKLARAPSVRSKKKLTVYTAEFNVVMGTFRYLPFSTGLLRAFALTDPIIRDNVQFMPFLYEMDTVKGVWDKIASWDAPDVFAFSVSMWNEQLNLAVAKGIKETYGDSVLVVFGGCHVPHHPTEYMEKHSFIDVCVRSEGEEAFRDILLHHIDGASFQGIPDVTYRVDDGTRFGMLVENTEHRAYQKDMDCYPSPYLTGLFDDLISKQTDTHKFQCIIETNRGCPFDCSFCYWAAGGLMTKYRFHSLDYTKDEITWTGKSKIPYVFGADSNFAMHPRDKEIAEHVVKTKHDYGYPDKFRVCWGKNTDEKVFQVAGILHKANLEKGITLARQSNDPATLKNIRRDNIKLSTYQSLQKRFMDQGTPTYTELILGLPGETVASWKAGVDEVLTSSHLKAQLFIYLCQVLPNTELWRSDYRKQHGIKTKLVELTEIHGSRRSEDWITEYEELVIGTNSLPYQDWRAMCKFSWMTMLLHSMKAGFFVMAWLWDRFQIPPSKFITHIAGHYIVIGTTTGAIRCELEKWDALLDRISVFGESRGQILNDYGNIYWDVEEAALLRMSEKWSNFYKDLYKLTWTMLKECQIDFADNELEDILNYQRLRMPALTKPDDSEYWIFNSNIPEYFDKLFGSDPVQLEHGDLTRKQHLYLNHKDWQSDKERFARETILWGRKSGTMLVSCEWKDAA